MRANDLREKSAEKLNEELASLKQDLFQLRFQLAINQLENPMLIKAKKKDIARVKTVLREMEIKAANGTEV